jgi:hypothetical protein
MYIALDKAAKDCTLPEFIQLRTPLTGYAKREGMKWVLDNGAFTDFHETRWLHMALDAIHDSNCQWLTMPDVVGDHHSTLQLFKKYKSQLESLSGLEISDKCAFVIQDGCSRASIPFAEISTVFLGGTTKFKLSRDAWIILEEAKKRGKWVHVGRVNTSNRIMYFHGIADSIDGSGIAKFSEMRDDAVDLIRQLNKGEQMKLEGFLEV